MIVHIVGARPQFIKLMPLYEVLKKKGAPQLIIHTGQHWEEGMSNVFFREFDIYPDQIFDWEPLLKNQIVSPKMLKLLTDYLIANKPDTIVVYGDTNSTILGSIASNSLNIPLAHVEAGLRSFNTNMPEENCRKYTDMLSDWHFVSSERGLLQLRREGLDRGKKHSLISGDIMGDRLIARELKLPERKKILFTLHRNTNVDNKAIRDKIIGFINKISEVYDITWPIHPRLRKFINPQEISSNINITEPQGHDSLIAEIESSEWIITDSGGLQKEAYFLKRPSIILRSETEWKELIESGNSFLVNPYEFSTSDKIANHIEETLNNYVQKPFLPLYGDGNAALKIANALWETKALKPNSIDLNGDIDDKRLIFASEVIRRITGIKINWSKQGASWPKSDIWVSKESIDDWTINSDFYTSDGSPDYIALIVFGASRLEEKNSNFDDELGRFNGENFCRKFIETPEIMGIPELHVLAEKLIQIFRPEFSLEQRESTPPTIIIDIDHLYAFRGFNIFHRGVSSLKDFFSGNWKRIKARFDSLDPFDSFQDLTALQRLHPDVRFQLFAWIGPKRGKFDRGAVISNSNVKEGLKNISKAFPGMGIHPSYSGDKRGINWIKRESGILSKLINQKVVRLRFHYLKMKIPIIYSAIDKTLIQEDWSMQFPRKCGYRAGVAVPIPIWLDDNRGAFNEYGLPHRLWFPVSIMDQNLKDLSQNELLNFLLEWNSHASRYGSGIQIASHWRFFGPNMSIEKENKQYENWVIGLKEFLKVWKP